MSQPVGAAPRQIVTSIITRVDASRDATRKAVDAAASNTTPVKTERP